MNTHQAASTDAMPRGVNHPLQARLAKARTALLTLAAVLLVGSSAPAAQSPAGQVVSWGVTEHRPYVRPGTVFTNVSAGGIGITKEGIVINWGGIYDPPAGLSNVVAVAPFLGGGLALKSDGTVIYWGLRIVNWTGEEIKVPSGLNEVMAIATGGIHCLALRSNGTVVAWGYAWNSDTFVATNVPPALVNVVGISAGANHSVALKRDGTVVAWGTNSLGQTDVPAGLNNVIQISAIQDNTLALKSDGSVVAWGDTNYDITLVPPGLTDVVQVACGSRLAVAVRKDGTVAYWGKREQFLGREQYEYATNALAALRDVVEISSTGYSGIARKRDGTFVAWGYAGRGIPPFLTDVVSLGSSFPGYHFLNSQAQLVDWLVDWDLQFTTDGLTNIAAFADGGFDEAGRFTLAARKDGTVVAWGFNDFGQMEVPEGLSNVVDVAAGATYGVALKSDGTVAVWGARPDPEFGGTTEITNVPPDLNNVRAIAASSLAILVVRSNGTVVVWGDDVPAGQPTLNDAVAVSFGWGLWWGTGFAHCLALRSNGTVMAWGNNSSGQTDVPAGLSNVVAISAGRNHSVALKSNGKVVVWGAQFGQDPRSVGPLIRTVPVGLKNVVAISAGDGGTYALVVDPKLSIARRAGSGVTLRFRSFLGQRYQVQYSPNLAPGHWFNLPGGDVIGTGADVEVIDSDVSPNQPTRFYRLVELD